MRAFRLTADNAMLFFEMCIALKADTEEERLQIMDAMVKLGKVEQVTQTPKTREEYIEHIKKHFKCAIVINKDDAQQEKSNG